MTPAKNCGCGGGTDGRVAIVTAVAKSSRIPRLRQTASVAFVVGSPRHRLRKERSLEFVIWALERRADGGRYSHGFLRKWRSPPEASAQHPRPGSRSRLSGADNNRSAPSAAIAGGMLTMPVGS